MIKWLFKTIAIYIASFFSLLVVAYGLLVLLSLGKAPLQPEVEAFLRPEPIAVAPERNGFYYWVGLAAPAGKNPIEYGRRSIAELSRQSPAAADSGAGRTDPKLRLVYDRKILCHQENRMPCLVLARQNAAQVRELAKGNAELLRRYVELLKFDQFATDMPVLNPMDPIPAHQNGFNLFTLARTLDAVDVSEGRSSEALDRLAARVGFLRRMYANSAELVPRMLAQALLAKDLEFLVEVALAEPGSAKAAAAHVSAIAAPMTVAERSPLKWIRYQFSNEFAWIDPDNPHGWPYSVCKAFLGGDFPVDLVMSGKLEERCGRWDMRMLALAGAPLMDRNAVANRWFDTIRQLRQINEPDTFSYMGRFQEVVAAAESRRRLDTPWRLRNPVGGWIGTTVSTEFAISRPYYATAIDLDRLFALTRLAVGLARDRAKEGGFAAQLKQPGVLDPATEKPFGWDAAKSQVFFIPLDPWIARYGRLGGIDGRVGLSLR